MSFILLIVGLFLLVKCADLFVDSCSRLAKSFGIPSLIIGLTIVAMGTSAPEAAVSIIASIKGNSSISMGNIVGSNICNLLLILGVSSLFATLKAKRKIITRDFIYSLFTYVLLLILVGGSFLLKETTSTLTRSNGFVLLCFLGIYMFSLVVDAKRSARKEKDEEIKFKAIDILFIIIGLAGIILGGRLVVNSASDIAKIFGVSDSIIALTIVAIGTSLPELVTSVVAARKGETDIAIGNVIGSNIFNILFILGISSVISPLTINFNSFIDIIIMLVIALVVYLFLLITKKIDNKKGIIMLLMYVIYVIYIIMR